MRVLFFVVALLSAVAIPLQGRDFIGISTDYYMVHKPKYDLPGNRCHPFFEKGVNSSAGLIYERILTGKSMIKTGIFIGQEFEGLDNIYIPVSYKYCFYQEPANTMMFGTILGVNMNFPSMAYSDEMDEAEFWYRGIELDVQTNIQKKIYVVPHAGLWLSGKLTKRIVLSMQMLFHCPLPQYVQFVTSYSDIDGKPVVEHNTNKNFNISSSIGIQIQLGKMQ